MTKVNTSEPSQERAAELFVSYARWDGKYREELAKHLDCLSDKVFFAGWSNREIDPGSSGQIASAKGSEKPT
jgi:hypothetical protein